jgi:hypothetical protein
MKLDFMTGMEREYVPASVCNFSGGGGGGGTQTTVQKSDPWSGQQPYLSQQFAEAQKLYQNKTPQYNQDAYNQALQAWEAAGGNQGSTFDETGYNNAYSAWQNSPAGGSVSVTGVVSNKTNPNAAYYTLSDGTTRPVSQGSLNIGGTVSGGAPRGAAPDRNLVAQDPLWNSSPCRVRKAPAHWPRLITKAKPLPTNPPKRS